LAKEFGAEMITVGADFGEFIEIQSATGTGDGKIFAQHWADFGFVAFDAVTNEMADDGAEENPPKFERAAEAGEAEKFYVEALFGEKLSGAGDGGARFGCDLTQSIAFQNAHAKTTQFFFCIGAYGDRGGERVARIRTSHDVKKLTDVGDGSCHRANDANPAKRARTFGIVAGGGNAAGSGLEPANAAEMRGHANRTAAIAADSTDGAARSDRGRFAAARTARGESEIPGIAGFSIKEIVRLVGHQEFGSVGVAEENGACGFEARDERGVLRGNVVFAEKRAAGAGPTGNVDGTFDADGNAVKRAERRTLCQGGFGGTSLLASAGFVEVDEGVELRLAGLDTLEMSFENFGRRGPFGAEAFENFLDREIGKCVHGLRRESKRGGGAGQETTLGEKGRRYLLTVGAAAVRILAARREVLNAIGFRGSDRNTL